MGEVPILRGNLKWKQFSAEKMQLDKISLFSWIRMKQLQNRYFGSQDNEIKVIYYRMYLCKRMTINFLVPGFFFRECYGIAKCRYLNTFFNLTRFLQLTMRAIGLWLGMKFLYVCYTKHNHITQYQRFIHYGHRFPLGEKTHWWFRLEDPIKETTRHFTCRMKFDDKHVRTTKSFFFFK